MTPQKTIFSVLCISAVLHAQSAAAQPEFATLTVAVRDADTGEAVYARVVVNEKQRQQACRVVDQEPFQVGSDQCYLVPERLTMEVPAGAVQLKLFRGLEYQPITTSFTVSAGSHVTMEYRLKRWTSMAARGYYSGDMHIHYPASVVPGQVLAEDLNVGTCISSWITGEDRLEESDDVEHVRVLDARHVYSTSDQEIERFPLGQYDGPVYLVNLKSPVHLDSPGGFYPMNVTYQRVARARGGIVCLHSSVFPDAPVSAALGEVDAVGLACNFFAYSYSMSRVARYGNSDDLALYGDTPQGTLRMALGKYYRLLNCGFRLPASAGSAAGVKTNPVGHNRVYVKIDDAFSYDAYFDAFRAGRSFVTNGPMLFLSVNDLGPGETIDLAGDAQSDLSVSVEAYWNQPIGKVEIIANGKIIESFAPRGNRKSLSKTFDWNPPESGWIAARISGEKKLPIRFAHTSPVYIHMPSCPLDPSEDAAYFAKWIGRRIEALDDDTNFTADWQREAVRSQLQEAEAVYGRMIRE